MCRPMTDETKNPIAVELGRRGGKSGGPARRESLSPERRSEIARGAVEKRWLRASHQGVLELNGGIACYVLNDGRRVLSQSGMVSALDMSKGSNPALGGDRLANFAAGKGVKPFISEELASTIQNPIRFRIGEERQAYGFEATALSAFCEAIVEADRAHALQTQQKHIAEAAWLLMKGFSRVGIIALVDEATGYQYDRARDELQKILKAYISDELLTWVARFPHEFFRQVFRLHGWEYKEGSVKGPMYVGKFINKVVYDQLPPPVLAELRKQNPPVEGRRKHKHHQFLTEDTGIPHLDKQILETTALMRAARDKNEFARLFERAFPKPGQQIDNGLGHPQAGEMLQGSGEK